MSDRRGLQLTVAFERFWDRLVRGEHPSAEGIDANLATAAERVHALDEPEQADPEFRRHLWEDLMNSTANPGTATLSGSPIFVPNGRVWRQPARPFAPSHQPSRQRPFVRAISFLMASLLIATVLGLILLFQQMNHRDAVPAVQIGGSPTPGLSSDWPEYRGDAGRTGAVAASGPVTKPGALWVFQTGGKIGAAPVLSGGTVFVPSSDGNFYALKADTGAIVWKAALGGGSNATALIAGGAAFVADAQQSIQTFDVGNGTPLRFKLDGLGVAEPGPIVGDTVITIGGDSFVHAVMSANGRGLWLGQLTSGWSNAAASDGTLVFAGAADGKLNAFDIKTGDARWATDLGGTIDVPTVKNGVVYATISGTALNAVVALDAKSGKKLWTFQTADNGRLHVPAVGDTAIFAPGADGNLYAIDAKTGKQLFAFKAGAPLTASPVLAGSLVYQAASDGILYAIDASTGSEAWRLALGSQSLGGPIVANGVIYVATESGAVMALAEGGNGATIPAAGSASPAASPVLASPSLPEFEWSTSGSPDAKLTAPLASAVAPDGKVWVADASGQFEIFDAAGKYLESWGWAGSGNGQFDFQGQTGPSAFLAFAPDGSFYVTDAMNARVQHFDKNRKFLGQWGTQGTGDGKFREPTGIAVAADGTVYVADLYQKMIEHFDANGKFLDHFDGAGTTDGKLLPPEGIAFDNQGRLIVVEGLLGRVRVFDKTLKQQVGVLDIGQQHPPTWASPNDVAVDAAGNIYVADSGNARVRVFGPDLSFKFQWGGSGQGDGSLVNPAWLTVSSDGSIYVSDPGNGRLVKFALPR